MSSTGNNTDAHPINALDFGHLTRDTPIIEPHVGSGNALRALLQEGHRGPIEILDIDPLVPGLELGRQLAAQGHHILVDTATPDAEAARWATDSTETAVFIFEAGRVLDPVEGPCFKGRWVIW